MSDLHIPGEGKIPGSPVKDPGVHWYPPGPVARAFFHDDSFVCGLLGPFGSGKSVTIVMKLLKGASRQPASPNGWKLRRTAIIRNTYPELRTTTMNTFFQWIPKHKGAWREAGPPMLRIRDAKSKLDWEIYFVALDRPDDVKKLLGMELSDAWINEAREVPKAIIDGLTGRVGRYPAKWQGGCYMPQILMDTNPPDTDHWWYVLAERDVSTQKNMELLQSIADAEDNLRAQGVLGKEQKLFNFYRQPGGRSPEAENVKNLRAGYYDILAAGKDSDFIKVYVDGEYGFVMDGKPVYPEYKDTTHAKDVELIRGLGIRLGFDFGLTPACMISQRLANGRWIMQDEFVTERMGILAFANDLSRHLAQRYPEVKIVSARGDPAGDAGKDVDPNVPSLILKANGFKFYESAPTNDPLRRKESMRFLLKNMVDGEPAIVFNRARMPITRKGMMGGYHYKRVQVPGEPRFRDAPEKNKYSHVIEAGEYDLVSGGEDRNITVSEELRNRGNRPAVASSEYDIFST